jgi:hypothetical protein
MVDRETIRLLSASERRKSGKPSPLISASWMVFRLAPCETCAEGLKAILIQGKKLTPTVNAPFADSPVDIVSLIFAGAPGHRMAVAKPFPVFRRTFKGSMLSI